MSDQTPQPTWRDSLPDDLKADATLATVPDVPTLAKNYLATKAMTGRKAYDLPDPNWKPEQWKEWNKTIGVPDEPSKYTPIDKAALEKAKLPAEVVSAALGKFHEVGLTDRQARGILDWFVGDAAKGIDAQSATEASERAAGEQTLKQEFGDKFDAKMRLVQAWIKTNADPDFLQVVEQAGLGNNPKFIKAIIKSAEKTLEDNSRMGIKSPLGAEGGKAAALAEIEAMKAKRLSDRAYAAMFENPKSAERQRWDELHRAAY